MADGDTPAKPTGKVPAVLPDGPAKDGSFVVVELYTSEGCSSCPPADAQLNIMAREARQKNLPLFCLAFHVAYWDELKTPHGVWKDPFSVNEFTQRQQVYNQRMPDPNPYKNKVVTPQFIINGRSPAQPRGKPFAAYMQSLLDVERPCRIKATLDAKADQFEARWTIDNLPDGANLYCALTEDGLVSDVTAGENAGRKLPHEAVVRLFHEIKKPDQNIQWTFQLPKGSKPQNLRCILLVQDPKDMAIHAATALDIPQAKRSSYKGSETDIGFNLFPPELNNAGTNCTPKGVCVVKTPGSTQAVEPSPRAP
jgi:hypothetical protein